MTILENLQNSRDFPPGILRTVDSREFPNANSQWPWTQLPSLKGVHTQFSAMSVAAKRLDGLRRHTWYGGRRDFVLDGVPHLTQSRLGRPSSLPKTGQSPSQFSAHFNCGQTAGCIKTPLGTEVGLRPGDFVLDGDPAHLPKKGTEPSSFRSMSVVAKRLDG